MSFRFCAALSATFLTGCQAIPAAGPTASTIESAAGKSATEQKLGQAEVFAIVPITAASAKVVSSYASRPMSRQFGGQRGGGSGAIGVGDDVQVTIFEAGSEGLFSTPDNKQMTLRVTVQRDGKASIPYIGPVRFAGRTVEQVRVGILDALRDKAAEPDVVVTTVTANSRSVTVSGAVNAAGAIPISLAGDRLLESIAKAGGASAALYESYVTLVRGERVARARLSDVVSTPSENVYVSPGDQIVVAREPRTFTVLGETGTNNRLPFGSEAVNLLEAVAMAGGGNDQRAIAFGYFIFRYEEPSTVEALLGSSYASTLAAKGMTADRLGRLPIVYQIDMSRPDALLAGQIMPVADRDVIYVSRHPSVDVAKVFSVFTGPVASTAALAATAIAVTN